MPPDRNDDCGTIGTKDAAAEESIHKAFVENDLETAYGRIAASFAHMVWTGCAGGATWGFAWSEGTISDVAVPRGRLWHIW